MGVVNSHTPVLAPLANRLEAELPFHGNLQSFRLSHDQVVGPSCRLVRSITSLPNMSTEWPSDSNFSSGTVRR